MLSLFIGNMAFALLIIFFFEEGFFGRILFFWAGIIIVILGILGLRYNRIVLIRGMDYSYEYVSDIKQKIGQLINIIGIILGTILFLYGIYFFMK